MSTATAPSEVGGNPSSSSSLLVIYATHDLADTAGTDTGASVESSAELEGEGMGVNKPVVRKRGIIGALQAQAEAAKALAASSSSSSSSSPIPSISFQPITTPAPDLTPALKVHSPGLIDLFDTGFQRWDALGHSGRDLYFSTKGRVANLDEADWSELIPSQVAPRDPCQRPGTSVHSQICFYAQDQMTPITKHTSTILRHDLAVTLAAVDAVQKGSHQQVYACTTQPGHHSSYNSYGGYCYVNQAALAAKLLSETHGKVAILDVDYHAGNGSISVFWNDPSVFVCSLHAHPSIEYPYCCGFEDQIGDGDGKGTTLNLPMQKGTTWSEYSQSLQKGLDAIKSFGAKYLIVSLGVDTLAHDPEAAPAAGFMLHGQDYTQMGRMIRAAGIPTIWIQEGGYKLDEAGEAVRRVLVDDESK